MQVWEPMAERDVAGTLATSSGYIPEVATESVAVQRVKAGFDWVVGKTPVYTSGGMAVPGQFALVRDATGVPLGAVVGSRYQPVQWDAMEVLQPLIDAGLATWDGVLKLRHGNLGVARARLNQTLTLPGESRPVAFYLLSGVCQDGTQANAIYGSAIRPVCENTYAMGKRWAGKNGMSVRVSHTASAQARIETARKAMVGAAESFRAFGTFANRASTMRLSDGGLTAIVERFIPANEEGELAPAKVAARERVLDIYHGRTVDGIRGTAWGGLQALSEYAQHWTKMRDKTSAARQDAVLFGRLGDMTERAVEVVEEVMGELV